MRIKRLKVNGFRSLVDFDIVFDDGLTVIVGENDSGKTSLIDCLKVITQGQQVTFDDISYQEDKLLIEIEIENFTYRRIYQKIDNKVAEVSFDAIPSQAYITEVYQYLSDERLDIDNSETKIYIKDKAQQLGLTTRANSNIATLKASILTKIENSEENLTVGNAKFPSYKNIQLDGRQFENTSSFFKEVFLKEKQQTIWQEYIGESITIEDFVETKIQEYASSISSQLHDLGIVDKMRIFLPDLTDVKIDLMHQPRNLTIEAKVIFLENGNEINIDNKGDGTKRRITMALLEYKKDKDQASFIDDGQPVYLLDEPDTHLHIKAQMDLLKTVEEFALSGSQVILTTHSPFIMNSVKPSQVRLLNRYKNNTSVIFLKEDPSAITQSMRALGIENTHLFFSRQIILVEGETEENFISSHYLARTQRTISSGLIKIINAQGIQNIPGFAKAILELHGSEEIYVLYDNDASQELLDLIKSLNLSEDQKFQIGEREFEDAFQSNVLYQCWVKYHDKCGKMPPESWSAQNIENLRTSCIANGKKFSEELKSLNKGGKKMTKPLFGQSLGAYIKPDELPEIITKIFSHLLK